MGSWLLRLVNLVGFTAWNLILVFTVAVVYWSGRTWCPLGPEIDCVERTGSAHPVLAPGLLVFLLATDIFILRMFWRIWFSNRALSALAAQLLDEQGS
jgi:hypothetical protein